jgi:hypothetical protein
MVPPTKVAIPLLSFLSLVTPIYDWFPNGILHNRHNVKRQKLLNLIVLLFFTSSAPAAYALVSRLKIRFTILLSASNFRSF